jgi:hypothetical protein
MWNQMSEREQGDCILEVFAKLVAHGVLSNRGRRNYTVLKGVIEKKYGVSILTNQMAWEAKVDKAIPKTVVSAAERNAAKIADAAAILGI